MSWFTRSIANTLNFGDDDDDNDNENTEQHSLNNNTDKGESTNKKDERQSADTDDDNDIDDSPLTPGRGVKEDLSEITKTLTRQFWGVASFLAPPPPAERSNEQSEQSDPEDAPPEAIYGIRKDFAEIGGRFRSGISKLSNNIDVSEITKMASSFLQLGPEDENYDATKVAGAIGVTDDVVAFVRDVAMHPETWLDFPLPEDEEENEDFDLSDAQQEHALAVESLVPRLAALRIELCPGYMSESTFWKIYFVLVHPRLERNDAVLLSTPEIMNARAALTQELKRRSTAQSSLNEDASRQNSHPDEEVALEASETEKHPVPTEEVQVIDKSVIQEDARSKVVIDNDEDDDDTDDWLKDETSEAPIGTTTTTTTTTVPIENDEDVSFSDLEEEDEDGDAPTKEWVQLDTSGSGQVGQVSTTTATHNKESNDWLDVDDIDVA